MQVQPRRNDVALILFIVGLTILITLALSSTTWAAPNAQGTVPTPPKPTAQPTASGGNGGGQDNGGQNNGGGQDNGGQDNNGGQNNGGNQGGSDVISIPTASAPSSNAGCVIAENGAQCTATNLLVAVSAGAAPAGSILTIEGPLAQPPCPASPPVFVFMQRCYRYAWTSATAEPLAEINAPVQYCFNFGAAELAATGNQPEKTLVGLANAEGKWVLVKPAFDAAAQRVCATTNQKIEWSALFAPQAALILLPTTGGAPTRSGYYRGQLWTPN